MASKTLKLLAQDAQDVQIIAAVLQDAVAPLADMTFRAAEKSFVMVVQRFCWDDAALSGHGRLAQTASEDEPALEVFERINCALDVDGVESVQTMGIDTNKPATILDLLTIVVADGALDLIFAGGGKIRLNAKKWCVRLHDFGESWPTTHCPRHAT